MPRFTKVDREATKARKFQDKRSFIGVNGCEYLRGKDVGPRRQKVIEIYGEQCRNCKKVFMIEADHIFPKWSGGCDCIENWMPLCAHCHRCIKHARYPRLSGVK